MASEGESDISVEEVPGAEPNDHENIKYDDFYGNEEEEEVQISEDHEDEEIEHGIFEEIRDTEFTGKTSKKNNTEIENLEDKLIKEKSWQLKGEVRGVQRPVNSLLEEDLEFQAANKQEAEEEEKVKIINSLCSFLIFFSLS